MSKHSIIGAIVLVGFGALPAQAQTVRDDLWCTNGAVYAAVVSGNLLYIGGDFTYVGPATGPGVPIDVATGQASNPFPRVAGASPQVTAATPDGAGGWFIGGVFTTVGGLPRSNIAHVLADNTVSDWSPNANGEVDAIAVSGSTVYVGGTFSNIGGQARNNLAALDATSGLATSWNPSPSGFFVHALAVSGSIVYVGGNFGTIGGQSRHHIAALDAVTGAATAWDPNPAGGTFLYPYVSALIVSGSTVYVAGSFSTIGFQFRNNLAAVDAGTGAATAWNPNPSGGASSLALSGSVMYVGGGFTNIGGQARASIAALDATTGNATAWNPGANSYVYALAVAGSVVYAGGSFTSIGGQARVRMAALDITTGNATAWDPGASNQVNALAVSGSKVYAGGYFNMVGGKARRSIAALDLTTGQATAWNPSADGGAPYVYALAVNGSTVYAAGDFSIIGGQTRAKLAALDATTGNASAWNPNPDRTMQAIAVSGSVVYAGGWFFTIGGQPRNGIAALDIATGNATTWNPNVTGTVFSLAVSGSTVYAGGGFSSVGGQPRKNIVAVDIATGNATAWDPTAGSTVYSLALSGSTMYVGGGFTFIGGQSRNRIAALDIATGNATPWNPGADNTVYTLAVGGSVLYAGGNFGNLGGQSRLYLGAIDAATGSTLSWNPAIGLSGGPTVRALALSGSTIYVAGQFLNIAGQPHANLAGISDVVGVGELSSPSNDRLSLLSHPNPGVGATQLQFTLDREAEITLLVYDITGREVARLADRRRFGPGPHEIRFEGRGLPSGVYLCLLRAGEATTVRRIVFMP